MRLPGVDQPSNAPVSAPKSASVNASPQRGSRRWPS